MPRSRGRTADRLATKWEKPRRREPVVDRAAHEARIAEHAERVAREEGPAPPPAQDSDGQMLLFDAA